MIPLAIIHSHEGYDGLQAALRARWKALGIAGETMDEVSGLTARYASKLLSPAPPKHMGSTSLGPVLGCLGCMLVLVEDEEMMARIVGRLPDRKSTSATKPTRKRRRKRSKLRGNSEWGRAMAARRMIVMSPRKRKEQARKAIAIRWAKSRASAQI